MEKSKRFTGVYLNKKSNGDISYYITYRDANEKFKRVKIGDKSKGITEVYCNQKRNEVINQVRLGDDPLAKKKKKKIVTLDDVAKIYFEQSIHNKDNHKTKNKYFTKLQKRFGHRDIQEITPEEIIDYQAKFLENGLSPSTINFDVTFLGTLYNIAIDENLFQGVPPTRAKKVKMLKNDNDRERYLSTDEINLLYENINDDVISTFTELSLSTGGRLETILNLKVKDIDFSNGVATLKDLKNDSTYKGFLQNDLLSSLKQKLLNLKPNTYVVGLKETKYATRTLQRKLQTILNNLFNEDLDSKDAKNRVVIHSLRHTFASHLATNGTPIFTIQKLMNHQDIKMTLRYAKLAPDSGKNFINDLYK
jgi:integrase